MKDTSIPDFEKSKNPVSVTLYHNNFLKEDEYIGRISKHTLTAENLIAAIAEKETELDQNQLYRAAILFKEQIKYELDHGNSVNIFDLFTAYIGLSDTVKCKHPSVTDIPEPEIRITPLPEIRQTLKHIIIDKIIFSSKKPVIRNIKDSYSGDVNLSLTPGNPCVITGRLLKLGGDKYSIDFIQVNNMGKEFPDTVPIPCEKVHIFKNTPSEINMMIPENLIPGAKYKIRITTSYIRKNISRKDPVCTESCILSVNS